MSSSAAFITENIRHTRIFQHEMFGVRKRIDITASDTFYVGLDATNVDCRNLVLLPVSVSIKDTGPLAVDVFVNSTFTGGTEWVGGDRNLVDAVTPNMQVYYNPTVSDVGTATSLEDYVLADKKSSIGGEVGDAFPFVLIQGIKYIIRFTETGGVSDGIGSVGLTWLETSVHTDDYLN